MFKKYFGLATGFVLFVSAFLLPTKAAAYSPIISDCSNGLLGTNLFLYPSDTQTVKQLFEVRLDEYVLDAAGVRLKGPSDRTSLVIVKVIKRDGPVISSATVTIQAGEAWAYVDLANAPIPRGVYYLQVEQSNPAIPVGWAYTSGTCIADSHVVINDEWDLDKDLGFGIYAYDNSTTTAQTTPDTSAQSPAASTEPQSNSSDSTSNTSTDAIPGSTTTPAQSSTSSQTTAPTAPSSTANNSNNINSATTPATNTGSSTKTDDSSNSTAAVDPSLTQMGPWAIAWFVSWGLLILLIILLVRRRKKKDQDKKNESEKLADQQEISK